MNVDRIQNFFSPIRDAYQSERCQETLAKVKKYAKKAFKLIAEAAVAVVCFLTNPSIFAVGFLIGIVFDKKVQVAVDKIVKVWKYQTWPMLAITGLAAFLSLPVTCATGSFVYATHLGSKISQEAQKRWDEKKQNLVFTT